MATNEPTVVLVHGAWAGAAAWDRVRPALGDRGIDHVAVELPGCGPSGRHRWRVSLDDYGRAVNAATGGRPAVVVGHSGGGVPITQAACMATSPHVALVYLAAYLPVDGERLVRLARSDSGSAMSAQIRPAPLRAALRLEPDGLEDVLYHDYEGDDLAALIEGHTLEPMRPGLGRITLTPTFHATPKYYVQCTGDRAISPAFQEWMCSRHDLVRVDHLDCGHMPMLVDPDGLADVLASILADATSHDG